MLKYLTSAKYRFFKKKIYAVQASIWELEFKAAKSRQVREGVRQDRDRAKEAISQIKAGLLSQPREKREEMEKQIAAFEENVTRYEAQMEMVDKQINGFVGDEKHEPVVGIIEQLKSYVELKLMYEDFIASV